MSYLDRLPRELLLLEASYLDNYEVRQFCASNKEVDNKLCRNSDFYQQQFEREFTTDRTWLYDYFLTDGEFLSREVSGVSSRRTDREFLSSERSIINLADIPASAFNYYEALREARFLTDFNNVGNDLRVNLSTVMLLQPVDSVYAAVRYRFDKFIYRVLDKITADIAASPLSQPQAYVGMKFESLPADEQYYITAARDASNFLIKLTESAMRHNRLDLLQAAITMLTRGDKYKMSLIKIVKKLNKSVLTNPAAVIIPHELYLRLSYRSEIITTIYRSIEAVHYRRLSFDQAFHNYLLSNLFDSWPPNITNGFDIAVAMYENDYPRFLTLTGAVTVDMRSSMIISNDQLDFFKHVAPVDLNIVLRGAHENSARQILDYLMTKEELKGSLQLQHLEQLNCFWTPAQMRYFFSADVLTIFLSKNIGNFWINETAIRDRAILPHEQVFIELYDTLNYFMLQTNYRLMVRLYSAATPVAAIGSFIAQTLTQPKQQADIKYYTAQLMLLQEVLRVDLVTDPRYRNYLAYIFVTVHTVAHDEIFNDPAIFNNSQAVDYYSNVYRKKLIFFNTSEPIIYLFFLYVKHYYLLNQLPRQTFSFTKKYEDNTIQHIYPSDVLIVDNTPNRPYIQTLQWDNVSQDSAYTVKTGIQDLEWLKKYI